jgi:hypothetical protein
MCEGKGRFYLPIIRILIFGKFSTFFREVNLKKGW